ncbi:putative pentatricopeptide repeat-containing protein [Ananas comosus]|uniref:Putative pentatricopeptide repeat-containing protein n=1 Tax=Ananas comosus TaxID=4615 RepID=A0A199W4U9_ANACO|nr:putative pentatricopeptide repeat-containing protein [Ananas comosus]
MRGGALLRDSLRHHCSNAHLLKSLSTQTAAFDLDRVAAASAASPGAAADAAHARLVKLLCPGAASSSSSSSSSSLWNKLLALYSRSGRPLVALKVFDKMPVRDSVSYNTMISSQPRTSRGALDAARLYARMLGEGLGPDFITFSALLAVASDAVGCARFVEQSHAHSIKFGSNSNGFVGSALVNAYVRCGGMDEAIRAFDEIAECDAVCWNVMIDVCARRGSKSRVVEVFSRMRKEGGAIFDCFTLTSVLKTCVEAEDLGLGMQLHGCAWKALLNGLAEEAAKFYKQMARVGETENEFCFASLLPAFSILASLEHGRMLVFETMVMRDLVSWTIMIRGFGQHGLRVFGSMVDDYNVKPEREHFACVVDLLGRSGRLKEAELLIGKMEKGMDPLAWETLLGACRIHGEVGLGQKSAEKVMELEPHKDGPYVLLSNMYAERRRWVEKEKLRERLDTSGLRKEAALSWFPALEG